jgi:aspartate-semialdehyde dehydrogenase
MLTYLDQMEWIDEEPLLLCSERSAGYELPFRSKPVSCRNVAEIDPTSIQLALFSAGATASREYAPLFTATGAWVVDNSSAYRMEPQVPLIVPEINPTLVPTLCSNSRSQGGIIANPNCSTIQIALALAPLNQAFGLQEVHVTTLQSVSGAGQRALTELKQQLTGEILDRTDSGRLFPQPIAHNVLPAIGPAVADGSFEEETKVVRELRKILDIPDLAVTCTATRVPVRIGHCAAVRVVLSHAVEVSEAARIMQSWPGLVVHADPHSYETPRQVSGRTEVYVGRLRQEWKRDDVLLFWVVADNLLKGAAWNAVQIAELLVAG